MPALFAGGDMVPAERNVTVGGGPRQEGSAPHRRVAARRALQPAPEHAPATFDTPEPLVLQPTRPRRCARSSTWRAAPAASTRCEAASTETHALFRSATLPDVAATASNATNCYGVRPDNAVVKLGAGQALRVQLRLLQRLWHVRRGVPRGAIEMVPRTTGDHHHGPDPVHSRPLDIPQREARGQGHIARLRRWRVGDCGRRG